MSHQRYLVVPDTNVCISGILRSSSPPGYVMHSWQKGDIEFALCDALLEEVYEVLLRPYFRERVGWSPQKVGTYVKVLRMGSLVIPSVVPPVVSQDPDDNVLFACAYLAGADFIVSGDKAHVLVIPEYKGIKTISPKDFIGLLS